MLRCNTVRLIFSLFWPRFFAEKKKGTEKKTMIDCTAVGLLK